LTKTYKKAKTSKRRKMTKTSKTTKKRNLTVDISHATHDQFMQIPKIVKTKHWYDNGSTETLVFKKEKK